MKIEKVKSDYDTMYQIKIGKALINFTIGKADWGIGIEYLADCPCLEIKFLCFTLEIG